MKLKIHQIDAFTDRVFGGNYAAVIVTDEWLPDDLMQSIATENNLSETAFAKKTDNCSYENSYENSYEIRWFSPQTEIAFCGHATLATAYVLFKQDSALTELNFSAQAVGKLNVRLMESGQIEMTFPLRKPDVVDTIPQALLAGLSIEPGEVLLNKQAYFVVYSSEKDVSSVQPNLEELKKLAPYDVVVTSTSSEYDFISRYFWPANGSGEDPVTGSIHAGLAPLWAERLGKNSLSAYQASERGGILHCRVSESDVVVAGTAVQYLEGFIEV